MSASVHVYPCGARSERGRNSRETSGAALVEPPCPPEALDDLPSGESTLAHAYILSLLSDETLRIEPPVMIVARGHGHRNAALVLAVLLGGMGCLLYTSDAADDLL